MCACPYIYLSIYLAWAAARAGAMVTLTSLLTSSPLHVLLVEVFTRYLKNYGVWPAISRVCVLCVGLG